MTQAQATIRELPDIHALAASERAGLMRRKYNATSRFQREFSADTKELDCGIYAQKLRDEVIRLLEGKGVPVPGGKLEKLHETLSPEMREYNFDDGVNKVTALLYDTDERFVTLYHDMIKHCLQHSFPYPFYFQATTTIRIHCPDARNSDHYPRYHTDIGYGHPPEEINIWIPLTAPESPQHHGFRLTDVARSRAILEPFGYDFAPFIERAVRDKAFNREIDASAPQVRTGFGRMLAFDSRCIHTGEPLQNHTRASIDVRIIAVEDFNTLEVGYQGLGRRRIRYMPGQAYYPAPSDTL